MAEVSAPLKVQFLSRVASIPLVETAMGYAGDGYNRIKGYNQFVGSTLNKAERSIQYVAETAKPVVASFEKPITYADNFACQSLDKLEIAVPVIKDKPEDFVKKYEDLKKYGTDRVESIKQYGFDKVNNVLATPYAQVVVKSVDSAVGMTENAIDRFLPPADDEVNDPAGSENRNVVQRVGALSEKMRNRMYKQAMKQVQVVQKRSQEALDRMKFSVDLIQYARELEQTGIQRVNDVVSTVQNQAAWIWEELKKEETTGTDQETTVDQRVLNIARRATKEVIHRYNELSAYGEHLPENARKTFETSLNYTRDVYTELLKAKSIRDVSDIAFHQISAGIALMQSVLTKTVSPLVERITKKEHEKSN